ncbi:ZIP family metal transporter [Leptolyngbya sp. 7M]|uniref:ZIP family metal transporter n=1 Tax=Leptolyngbya sp. 7M TaxID=2812896 RepID=UPI001B8A9A79|nr:ZIP family metal transporter [Leptolyngbya sp. 7M]QYO65921.1 ZIP family metal transporter [Leptolyngbya sp. 7M]
METGFHQLVIFGLLAAAANVLGGLVLLPSRLHGQYRGLLKYLLAVGAGFMISVALIELIPRTVELWKTEGEFFHSNLYIPMLLLLGGYLLTQFFEHTIAPHFHLGEEVHPDNVLSPRSAFAGVGGLLMHTFFDGVSIAAASQIDYRVGLLVFVAVFLHKFPEGFTIGSMMLAAGKGRREVLIATSLVGITTLFGVLLYHFAGTRLGLSVAYALPVACGITLYVAASDLIPEVNHHGGKRPFVSLSVFAGVGLFFLLHITVHELIGH